MTAVVDLLIFVLQVAWFALIIRILLSWFPGVNWNAGFFRMLDRFTEPMLEPFRRIIPPIGGMLDISPIIPFFILQILIGLLSPYSSGMVPYF